MGSKFGRDLYLGGQGVSSVLGVPVGLDDLAHPPSSKFPALEASLVRCCHRAAAAGYLEAIREIADSRGIVLIYDEVITGFRLGYGGAQGIYGIKPDISVFAKGLGGGFPVAALGGCRDIMKLVADGTVSMAGTYSANGIAVAAANAALDELGEPGKYEALFVRCARFYAGLGSIFARHGLPAYVAGLGPVLQVWFAEKRIRNYRDAERLSTPS
jgi:glutamate-1-semialdehyde 2,1-aminomutase